MHPDYVNFPSETEESVPEPLFDLKDVMADIQLRINIAKRPGSTATERELALLQCIHMNLYMLVDL